MTMRCAVPRWVLAGRQREALLSQVESCMHGPQGFRGAFLLPDCAALAVLLIKVPLSHVPSPFLPGAPPLLSCCPACRRFCSPAWSPTSPQPTASTAQVSCLLYTNTLCMHAAPHQPAPGANDAAWHCTLLMHKIPP